MPVYFCNKEPIDLNAIAIMGVSVKTGNTPIGYFGTGLKFSIATLLRTGHEVILKRDGVEIVFSVDRETIRGESFDRVKMGDERLGFTTKLGRNWEVWQAYRELYCNCLDEAGVIDAALPEGDFGTIFVVKGEGIEACHRNRHEIFLSTNPISHYQSCDIHNNNSQYAYYRGVRVHKHGRPAIFTYNILGDLELTEDRTAKYAHLIEHYAECAIAGCDDEDIIEEALMAPEGTFEQNMDYSAVGKPSLAFMTVAFRLRHNAHCNRAAIRLWEKHADVRLTYEEVDIDVFEQDMLDKALTLVERLGVKLERADFMVVSGLGEGIFGCVRGSRILIAKRTFDMGHRFLASTLYEEHLHKAEGLADHSRDLQNLLFEKLFAMVERVAVIESKRLFA